MEALYGHIEEIGSNIPGAVIRIGFEIEVLYVFGIIKRINFSAGKLIDGSKWPAVHTEQR